MERFHRNDAGEMVAQTYDDHEENLTEDEMIVAGMIDAGEFDKNDVMPDERPREKKAQLGHNVREYQPYKPRNWAQEWEQKQERFHDDRRGGVD